jgi:hypothetical protein
MNHLAELAGHLQVRLSLEGGRIREVSSVLRRPRERIAMLLAGRTPEQALACLPLLFSLCAGAQQVAAVRALEQAAGWQPRGAVETARTQLAELELIRESLLRLLQGWELPVPLARLRGWLEACRRGIDQLLPAAVLRAEAPGAAVLGAEVLASLAVAGTELPASTAWLAARLGAWRAIAPAAAPPAALSPASFAELLPALRRGSLAAQLGGGPRVTGPAAATAAGSFAGQIDGRVAALLQRTHQALESLSNPAPAHRLAGLPGEGLGLVQTARGWLLQRVRLRHGRIAVWQMLAPTDWNFHPDGPLRRQLEGVFIDPAGCAELVGALVTSLDPCVEFAVELAHA